MHVYRHIFAFCIFISLFTWSKASTIAADPYAELGISDRYPCKGQPVTFTVTTRNISANRTYVWKFNDEVQQATGTTFTLRNNSTHYLKEDDYIVCIVTDNVTGRWIAAVLTGVRSYDNQEAKAEIYSPVTSLTFCKGESPRFGYTIAGGDNPNLRWDLTWQVNGVDVAGGVGPGAAIEFPANYELHDGDRIQARVNFSGKCIVANSTLSNELKVHIIDAATASLTITPVSVNGCVGDDLTFTANLQNLGDVTYKWTVNGEPAGTNSDTFKSAALANGDKVKCTVISNKQCEIMEPLSAEVTVSLVTGVINNITITSSAKDGVIELGQPVVFRANTSVIAGVSYQWQVNGLNVGTDSPVYTANDLELSDKVTCLVTTPGSCPEGVPVRSNEITILKVSLLALPNTFSPNGDGVNDIWSIPGLSAYPKCRVTIFNRYGRQVYNSVGYAKAWDGKFNGAPLPAGSYYYIIYLDQKLQKVSGWLTILR